MKGKVSKILNEVMFYITVVVVSIVLAVFLRVFVVTSIIKIPSGSMEPAVMAGDRIIANKQIPGPRIFRNIRKIRVDGKIQTKRFNGIRKVRRNDVLVFNFPYSAKWDKIDMNLNVYYLKRCVAIPGDTFLIENGIYKVIDCADSLGWVYKQRELSVKSQNDFSSVVWQSFPFDSVFYHWNIKDFGPLYVPASGSTITLDTLNIRLYKNLIEYESDKGLSIRESKIFLGNEVINRYTFKLNYYFMAGDNVLDSGDSRYWGMLPEDCIIGKAIIVWRSTDPYTGKIRWKRFFKIIR